MPYVPPDPARPWRDFQVQNGARRFLNEVVLLDWRNHPPPDALPEHPGRRVGKGVVQADHPD